MPGGFVGASEGLETNSMFWSLVLAGFAAFGGMLFGYDTGTISGIIAMPDWLATFGTKDTTGTITTNGGYYVATNDKSLVVSILSAGTFFGALLASPWADFIGRKYGLIAACGVFSLGVGLQLDSSWAAFIAGRFFAGLGVGLVSTIVPMYQSECSPKKYRGFIIGLYQFAVTIGILLAAIVNNATKDHLSHAAWRIPIALQFAWAAILAGGMCLLPESPRFLFLKNREAAALKSLAKLLQADAESDVVKSQAALIQQGLEIERQNGVSTYADCFKNNQDRNLLRTMTGIFIQACSQLTGINFIFYYGTTFFQRSGIQNPYTVSVITDVVNVVSTLPGIWAIDRIGRRKLLIGGAIGMCVCEFLVAIIGVTIGQPQSDGTINTSAQRSLIAFTCIYIFFFASTWGPCVWTITGEIFALPVRAKSMGFAVASNWLWNFAIGYATPYLVDPSTTGPQGIKAANLGVMVFFLWGSTCAFCVAFAFFFVPELAGLSLEQVDVLYRESSIVGSNKFRKQLLAEQGTGLTPRDETRLEMGQRTSDSLQADEDKTRDAHLD